MAESGHSNRGIFFANHSNDWLLDTKLTTASLSMLLKYATSRFKASVVNTKGLACPKDEKPKPTQNKSNNSVYLSLRFSIIIRIIFVLITLCSAQSNIGRNIELLS